MQAFSLLNYLRESNSLFNKIIQEGLDSNQIRYFGEEEFNKMRSQNYIPPVKEAKTLEDMFILGFNIGDCKGMSYQLSYSYNNVDIVTGILPILKGTKGAEIEGGHVWLETRTKIIDTSLMLIINTSYKDAIGYKEEYRITAQDLSKSSMYQARKEWTNDPYINNKSI